MTTEHIYTCTRCAVQLHWVVGPQCADCGAEGGRLVWRAGPVGDSEDDSGERVCRACLRAAMRSCGGDVLGHGNACDGGAE